MTIEFVPRGEENEPPLTFGRLWAAVNHVESHQESGVIRCTFINEKHRMETQELRYEDGRLVRTHRDAEPGG